MKIAQHEKNNLIVVDAIKERDNEYQENFVYISKFQIKEQVSMRRNRVGTHRRS